MPDEVAVDDGPLCLMEAFELSEYSYFTPAVLASWAGPLHWKINKKHIISKGTPTTMYCANYTRVLIVIVWWLSVLSFGIEICGSDPCIHNQILFLA